VNMVNREITAIRVGLTYDLASDYRSLGASEEDLAEFDREDTIEGIEQSLRAMGHVPERIGSIQSLAAQLVAGRRWDLVFNIAEGRYGAARESQVPALLDAYQIPYTFSDPLVLAIALHKGHAKTLVRAAGVRTADYQLIETPDDIAHVQLCFPLFAKPAAEGTSKGITANSVIRTVGQLRTLCTGLLNQYKQAVLLESYLPGREFTVGILGSGSSAQSLGSLEVHMVGDADVGVYTYRNKKEFVGKVEYRWIDAASDSVVAAAEAVALSAWRALGCRDAGRVDIRLDDQGSPCFIEANPLAGLNPTISDLAILVRQSGFGYQALIEGIVNEAAARL
jgi:D-alanine-D-alanine ligase